MFHEAFQRLELDEVATILDQISGELEGVSFDPVQTTVMALTLPFYPGYRLLDIGDYTTMPPLRRFVVHGPQKTEVLNFTNAPIYRLNKQIPLQLDEENVAEYVRFFFSYVRGKHGRFLMVENVDDIAWKEDPPPAARKAIGKMLGPILLKVVDNKGNFKLTGCMVFKDSLFRSDITVQPKGVVSLSNEQLMIEDMPVLDDTLGQ